MVKAFLIIFAAAAILSQAAHADTIYFKNGGTIEGIVTEEDEVSVIVDLGVGTMAVRKDEISKIEKASPEENARLETKRQNAEISRGEWAPLGYEDVRLAYRKSKDIKESLRKLKQNSAAIKDEISLQEGEIAGLLKILDQKSRDLKTIDADKRIKEYNAVVGEMNSLSAKLNKENSALKDLYAGEKKINAELMQTANKYRAAFGELKDSLIAQKNTEAGYEASDEELMFFEEMNERVREMESDFKKDIVNYISEGNQIVVDALINNSVLTRLVVDTGASIVVISKDVGERLGVMEDAIDTEIEIVMANGMSVNAKPVTLRSIKVGDAEVKNVQAAMLEGNIVGGTDGLLGMTFLSSFVVGVDASSNKLILEQILE